MKDCQTRNDFLINGQKEAQGRELSAPRHGPLSVIPLSSPTFTLRQQQKGTTLQTNHRSTAAPYDTATVHRKKPCQSKIASKSTDRRTNETSQNVQQTANSGGTPSFRISTYHSRRFRKGAFFFSLSLERHIGLWWRQKALHIHACMHARWRGALGWAAILSRSGMCVFERTGWDGMGYARYVYIYIYILGPS